MAALGDELETGRQFEDGEIGALKFKDGKGGVAAYDSEDEAKSQDAAVAAVESVGYTVKGVEKEWVDAKANGTQEDFLKKMAIQHFKDHLELTLPSMKEKEGKHF